MPSPERRRIRVCLFRPRTTFDDALRADHPLVEQEARSDLDVELRVFVLEPRDPTPPGWAEFVEQATVGALPDISTRVTGAVVLVRIDDRLWALTFGFGFLYINDDRLEPQFGLRTALNVVDPEQLLSVGSKVIEDVVVSTSRQASRRAAREVFTIDDTRDILREVVGSPRDEASFGRQVTGGSALTLTIPVEVDSLGGVLRRLGTAHSQDTYKEHFGFIDFIAPVQDHALRDDLDEELVAVVAGLREGDAYLATPEPIIYDDLAGFLHLGERISEMQPHPELDLKDYRNRISPADVSADALRLHQVRMVSASAEVESRSWSVYRCLVYETTRDGRHFLLSEGDWFAVERTFVERINQDIAAIPVVDLGLPKAQEGEPEAAYNRRAAEECGFALLDRKPFGVGGTSIEVADLLTGGRHLIHVKRKTQSSTLSHLFAQGRVSAESLKIEAGLRERVAAALDSDGRTEAAIFRGDYRAADMTVVYAVIAENAAHLPAKLPFFSRLNLWHARRFLAATLDYRVAFTAVPYD